MARATERLTPRISVNKFAEYLDLPGGAAGRRRQIIQDAKFPPDFKKARYGDAKRVISQAIARGEVSFVEAVRGLRTRTDGSDWVIRDRQLSANAIEAFAQRVLPQLAPTVLGIGATQRPGDPWNTLLIGAPNGVEISVAPDVVLSVEGEVVGLVKLHLVAGYPMTEEAGALAAMLLRQFAVQQGWTGLAAERLLLLDVFNENQQVFMPPEATTRRQRRVEETCAEIARLWASIEPPDSR